MEMLPEDIKKLIEKDYQEHKDNIDNLISSLPTVDRISLGYEIIIEALKSEGYNTENDIKNFKGSDLRAAKALCELIKPLYEIKDSVKKELDKTFPTTSSHGGMVLLKNKMIYGVCPHHILPVIMRVSLGYIPKPNGMVLGISKLARIASLLAGRPILQEQLASDLADIFYKDDALENFAFDQLESQGSIVFIEGMHMCMACRGAKADEAKLITSEVRGVFADNISTRAEAMDIITKNTQSFF